jgi:hypothetical protein
MLYQDEGRVLPNICDIPVRDTLSLITPSGLLNELD